MTRLKRRYEERRQSKRRLVSYTVLGFLTIVASVSVFFFTMATSKVATETLRANVATSSDNVEVNQDSSSLSSSASSFSEGVVEGYSEEMKTEEQPSQEVILGAQEANSVEENVVEVATTQVSQATQAVAYSEPSYVTSPASSQSVSVTASLSNGNTAGVVGSAAAAQMAAATGVPQSTWEYIIARESNGDPNVSNASGASGLFQTMPGWGSTATVQDQINAAINAYNSQGLSAWGY
ncbi:transglycosylase SLT domain-containing protein [Streptococcus sp. zg-JUN1979]|uniref:transglycosylase SLT domain-containing protein n=1 Tax=Streptococcus sp. zg-JUN1979 TaxID=3391450 RepID=UPI0039A55F96